MIEARVQALKALKALESQAQAAQMHVQKERDVVAEQIERDRAERHELLASVQDFFNTVKAHRTAWRTEQDRTQRRPNGAASVSQAVQ